MPTKVTNPALKSTKADVDNAIKNSSTIEEEIKKRVLKKGLSQLFKLDVLNGPVYTVEVLKTLHREHLGTDPTEEFDVVKE